MPSLSSLGRQELRNRGLPPSKLAMKWPVPWSLIWAEIAPAVGSAGLEIVGWRQVPLCIKRKPRKWKPLAAKIVIKDIYALVCTPTIAILISKIEWSSLLVDGWRVMMQVPSCFSRTAEICGSAKVRATPDCRFCVLPTNSKKVEVQTEAALPDTGRQENYSAE